MHCRTKLSLVLTLAVGLVVVGAARPVPAALSQPAESASGDNKAAMDLWDDALIAILTALCAVIGCDGVPATAAMRTNEAEVQAASVIQCYASNGVLADATRVQMMEGMVCVDCAMALLESPPAGFDADIQCGLEATLYSLRAELLERLEE